MSIQDNKYLKQNSRENSVKLHFPFNYSKINSENNLVNFNIFSGNVSLNTFSKRIEDKNDFVLNNVFTIHILDVFLNEPISSNYIISVYANDNKMDSMAINNQSNLNITGREYEKTMINPLAKVTELKFKLCDFDNNEITDIGTGNISIVVRNYEPQTEFNDNYNELNPQYNPHVTLDYTSSDEED